MTDFMIVYYGMAFFAISCLICTISIGVIDLITYLKKA